MKTKLLVLLLLAAGAVFADTHVVIGVGIGPRYGYYRVPPPAGYFAPCPGPGYVWVPGYWVRVGPRPYWREGYWAPPRHPHRYWRGWGYPRYDRDYRYERHHHRHGRW